MIFWSMLIRTSKRIRYLFVEKVSRSVNGVGKVVKEECRWGDPEWLVALEQNFRGARSITFYVTCIFLLHLFFSQVMFPCTICIFFFFFNHHRSLHPCERSDISNTSCTSFNLSMGSSWCYPYRKSSKGIPSAPLSSPKVSKKLFATFLQARNILNLESVDVILRHHRVLRVEPSSAYTLYSTLCLSSGFDSLFLVKVSCRLWLHDGDRQTKWNTEHDHDLSPHSISGRFEYEKSIIPTHYQG